MNKLGTIQLGNIGVQLALAAINARGLAACVSNEGETGYDLEVLTAEGRKTIEVYTRQLGYATRTQPEGRTRIGGWGVNLDTKGDADFFMFVTLDLKTMNTTYQLLTAKQARAAHRGEPGKKGSCSAAWVRNNIVANDFSALGV